MQRLLIEKVRDYIEVLGLERLQRRLKTLRSARPPRTFYHSVLYLKEETIPRDFVFVTTNKDASLTLAELNADPMDLRNLAHLIWRYMNNHSTDQVIVQFLEDDDRGWLVTRTTQGYHVCAPGSPTAKVTFTVSKN